MKRKDLKNINSEFEQVLTLNTNARNRVYVMANTELVHLYFNVGKLVAEKIEQCEWGEGTVNVLASFIQSKILNLSGFNRRGLYRMKQFYKTYSSPQFLSTMLTQIQPAENEDSVFVSAVPTQIQNKKNKVQPNTYC